MKKATILSATITLTTILILPSKPVNANPYQDVNTVVKICNYYARNYYEYQACLHEGARLIRVKYLGNQRLQFQPVRRQIVRPQNPTRRSSGGYFNRNRREFHPCDNPIVPTSSC